MTTAGPRLAFYGDDFTGSTDAMESLARNGLRTVLFTRVPTTDELAAAGALVAFGVASHARSLSPDEMERTTRGDFERIAKLSPPIVHYKVCSTFDSSPTIGSIGRAIDVGASVFGTRTVPVVAGAPALGRFCAFGNLFARSAGDANPVRLDRHPNMSRHPVTPMNEGDIRLHLARQTERSIALLDLTQLAGNAAEVAACYESLADRGVVLIDYLDANQTLRIGALLLKHAQRERPLFCAGSSAIESALAAVWATLEPDRPAHVLDPVIRRGPILVACGSCSPVTARQIERARADGFAVIDLPSATAVDRAVDRLAAGESVVIHTGGATGSQRNDNATAAERAAIAASLGDDVRQIVERSHVKRVCVAGGDTSGQIAESLGIRSLEMVGELVRGAPLCRATRGRGEPVEVVFKGGQIGGEDFFSVVENGRSERRPAHAS